MPFSAVTAVGLALDSAHPEPTGPGLAALCALAPPRSLAHCTEGEDLTSPASTLNPDGLFHPKRTPSPARTSQHHRNPHTLAASTQHAHHA